MFVRSLFAVLACTAAAGFSSAETWERFRGPRGEGTATNQSLPIEFSPTKNLVWKVAIPGLGNSSPVVWNDRLFVQTASSDGSERTLLCLDVKTGKTIWERKTRAEKHSFHKMNSLASSTPTTDGSAIYLSTWDGRDIVLSAVSIKGDPMWEKNLGAFKSEHGAGASPVVYRDKVYFALDMDGKAALLAFDKKSGKEAWSQPREAFRASYSSPQFLERGPNGTELVVTSTTGIASYNPDTGTRNWNWTWTWPAKTKPLRTVASSVEAGGMLFACSGDGGGDRLSVGLTLPTKPGESPTVVWSNRKEFPYVPCPLVHGGHVYFANDKGFAGCFDAKTGKQVWYERIGSGFTASPVLVDGKIYAGGEDGDVYVFAAQPKFELLARNRLDERIRATPAVADGRLFVRGANHLFCFGKKE